MESSSIRISLAVVAAALVAAACGSSTSQADTAVPGRVATSPGVSGTARGALIDVERNVRFAFAALEVAAVGEQPGRDSWVIHGKKKALDITVTLVSQSPAITVVEVRARQNETQYDNEFGQQLLNKILGR